MTTTVTGIDSLRVLRQNIRIARHFTPMTPEEMAAYRKTTAPHAVDGRFELYKTTALHEGDEGRTQHGYPTTEAVAM